MGRVSLVHMYDSKEHRSYRAEVLPLMYIEDSAFFS